MKKILMIISLLILSITILAATSDNSDIPVNVKILKHVEISVVENNPMDNWDEVEINNGFFQTTDVYSLDPNKRENHYQTTTTRLKIFSNTRVKIRSYFRINSNYMKSDFYNDSYIPGGENPIEGSIMFYEDAPNGFDQLPMTIVREKQPVEYTDITFNHKSELYVDYRMRIKFTDDNWWKILAGTHTIGQIVVTVEAQ